MPSPSVTPQVTGSASGTMAVKPQSEALICVTSLRRSCTLPRQRDRVTQAKLIQTAQVRDIERHSGNFLNAVDTLDYIRDRGSYIRAQFLQLLGTVIQVATVTTVSRTTPGHYFSIGTDSSKSAFARSNVLHIPWEKVWQPHGMKHWESQICWMSIRG